jgi:glycosyltransferase involved in cell wall biosynthesis
MTCATAERDTGARIDIATTDYGLTQEWRAHIQNRLPKETALFVFREGGGLDAGWSWRMVSWLWKHARDYDVIHIHAMFSTMSSAAAFIALREGVPYIIRPLGTLSPYTFENRKPRLKRAYFALIDRNLIQRSFALHFTAKQEAEKAGRFSLKPLRKVIPLPFASRVPTVVREAASRDVLFVSRLHPKKGLNLLIPAFGQIAAQYPDSRLVIAGSGEAAFESGLRAAVATSAMAERVTFVGFVEGREKERLLLNAAVFALPSYEENFGIAIAEALAVGLPVVITKGVDIWADVERYRSGFVAESTVEGVANAIDALLSDSSLRAEMGAQGKKQVAELYAPELVGEQLLDLYRSALRRKVL